MKHHFNIVAILLLAITLNANSGNRTVGNPILPGFHPDPSICAVDSDYYLVNSSFVFVPGLPVYHSRDLMNWELISHGIDQQNISKFHFGHLNDNDGVWASHHSLPRRAVLYRVYHEPQRRQFLHHGQ